MAWFTGKQTSEPMDSNDAAISDKEWQRLQERATKANPRLADTFIDEANRKRGAAVEQYRKRTQS